MLFRLVCRCVNFPIALTRLNLPLRASWVVSMGFVGSCWPGADGVREDTGEGDLPRVMCGLLLVLRVGGRTVLNPPLLR